MPQQPAAVNGGAVCAQGHAPVVFGGQYHPDYPEPDPSLADVVNAIVAVGTVQVMVEELMIGP